MLTCTHYTGKVKITIIHTFGNACSPKRRDRHILTFVVIRQQVVLVALLTQTVRR